MESPSTQFITQPEMSIVDFDGLPSSPFVTEVETNSRIASAQWLSPTASFAERESSDTPLKMSVMSCDPSDKENDPQIKSTATLVCTSPEMPTPRASSRPSTPPAGRMTPSACRGSADNNLMPPPPSARRTPKKTPLRSSRSGANTPQRLTRHNSFEHESDQTASILQAGLDERHVDCTNVDETCCSTFSEMPDMTLFAKLGQTPTSRGDLMRTPGDAGAGITPRTSRKRASISRSPSPTPRRLKTPTTTSKDETTTFLIDFTQQIEGYRPVSPVKAATESNLLQHIANRRSPIKSATRSTCATPSKHNNILNLLDFELPPAPTPRSIPTITVRELESLKSSYLSQISSLKATLSGREAEVDSLKTAVGDAERRVGEAQEARREEVGRREHVEQEKAEWEKRGKEVEAVLQSVKEEVIKSEAEKEDMLRKLEKGERRMEDAEARAVKAEERFADALAARADPGDSNAVEEQVQRLVAAQIDAKIEAVSRELHAVYKEKHERKVTTLKKSYEARGERKCAELLARVAILEKQNEDLAADKDATFSGPVASSNAYIDAAELKAQLEQQKAALVRLETESRAAAQQHAEILRELQQERIEKGDLVAAVDEMLALQTEPNGPAAQGAMSMVEDFRKSIVRSAAPAVGRTGQGFESRIGRGLPALNRSVSGNGAGGKSRILASIEKMGRTGGQNGGAAE